LRCNRGVLCQWRRGLAPAMPLQGGPKGRFALVNGFPNRNEHRVLLAHFSTHIRMAHGIHHHPEIGGCLVRRRAKGMTCPVQHQLPGQTSVAASVSELPRNCCEVPAGSCIVAPVRAAHGLLRIGVGSLHQFGVRSCFSSNLSGLRSRTQNLELGIWAGLSSWPGGE